MLLQQQMTMAASHKRPIEPMKTRTPLVIKVKILPFLFFVYQTAKNHYIRFDGVYLKKNKRNKMGKQSKTQLKIHAIKNVLNIQLKINASIK